MECGVFAFISDGFWHLLIVLPFPEGLLSLRIDVKLYSNFLSIFGILPLFIEGLKSLIEPYVYYIKFSDSTTI